MAVQSVDHSAHEEPTRSAAAFAPREAVTQRAQMTSLVAGLGVVAPQLKSADLVNTEPRVDLEHHALAHSISEVERLARASEFEPATSAFVRFRQSLEAHLDEEERTILPEFAGGTLRSKVVLPLLHSQHAALRVALDQVGAALGRADYPRFHQQVGALERQLLEHQETEERLLPSNDS